MISSRIKIGSGKVQDMYNAFGLAYVSSDTLFSAPLKGREITSYPEEEGAHVSVKTVRDTFVYKVKLLVLGDTLSTINSQIDAFNEALMSQEGSILTFNRVTFYNDYKGVVIVGIPDTISAVDEFWIDPQGTRHDAAIVEWQITVDKPSACNFNA